MSIVTDYAMHEEVTNPGGFVITATDVDDTTPIMEGFGSIANAADLAMYEVLEEDLLDPPDDES